MRWRSFRPALRIIAFAVLGSGALCSCGMAQESFLTVQLCVGNEQGVATFKEIMQSIAATQKMRYVDASEATQRDLKTIGATEPNMHAAGGLIVIAVEASDGLGLTAGNVGLNSFDVVLGITKGSRPVDARRFSDVVMKELQQRWVVKTLPPRTGAFPDPACVASSSGGDAPPNKSLERTRAR
jgi:hypothetical protein